MSKAESKVTIEYCPGCKWMLRSAYYAQELLSTFEGSVDEVALRPSKRTGNDWVTHSLSHCNLLRNVFEGTFMIKVNEDCIWDRTKPETSGFPDIKVLKQLVRDRVAPEKSLGHSDKLQS